MIAARPNAIPQYKNTYGADFPRTMKFKLPHEKYQHTIKRKQVENLPANPLNMLCQRNQMDQSLPSMETPFDLRNSLSKLGGIPEYYGTSTQSGKPLLVQKGLGKDNLAPRKPLVNRNF